MVARPIIHVIDDDAAMRDSLAFLLDVQGFEPCLHESRLCENAVRIERIRVAS